MATSAAPDLHSFETYYGLQVSYVGEDGDVIILGHHHDHPLRVIAALNRHAREVSGLTNLLDDRRADVEDLAGFLQETHAVLIESCDDEDLHDDYMGTDGFCPRCRELAEADWWIEWNHTAGDPGAFPVTMWRT